MGVPLDLDDARDFVKNSRPVDSQDIGQSWDALDKLCDLVIALCDELDRFYPVRDPFEIYTAEDGEPAIRGRKDLYEQRDN